MKENTLRMLKLRTALLAGLLALTLAGGLALLGMPGSQVGLVSSNTTNTVHTASIAHTADTQAYSQALASPVQEDNPVARRCASFSDPVDESGLSLLYRAIYQPGCCGRLITAQRNARWYGEYNQPCHE